ncbi:MAG: hypothetical protein KY445_11270 [Armatimonadetes bacterium]|nr:hypothetical protein [Armatimonadota bacterium]
MKTGVWTGRSNETVTRTLAALPASATLKEAKKALSDAYPFGQRSMYPYKAWCVAVDKHLRARFREEYRALDRAALEKRGATLPDDGQQELF